MAQRSSLGYLRPYRRMLLAGVVMLVVTNLCFLGVLEFLKRAVDALSNGNHAVVPSCRTGWMFGWLTRHADVEDGSARPSNPVRGRAGLRASCASRPG